MLRAVVADVQVLYTTHCNKILKNVSKKPKMIINP